MNVRRSVASLCVLLSLGASAAPENVFFTACQGKTARVACSVELSDGTHEGVCRTDDRRETACMPLDTPPAPSTAVQASASSSAAGK